MPASIYWKNLPNCRCRHRRRSGNFDRAVHERINNRLIVGQIVDFLVRGFGFRELHFLRSVIGLVAAYADGKVGNTQKHGSKCGDHCDAGQLGGNVVGRSK